MDITCLQELQVIISIISVSITFFIGLITIIVTSINANKQVKVSKEAQEQQKQQYEYNLELQKDRYEKEREHNQNIEIIREKPYLVFVESSGFTNFDSSHNTISITFRNKGNGSAFHIIPDIGSEGYGNLERNIKIVRNTPIQDPIAMVGESFNTCWTIDKLDEITDVLIPITIEYKDASDRTYQQTFNFAIDNNGKVMLTNYAKPELIRE